MRGDEGGRERQRRGLQGIVSEGWTPAGGAWAARAAWAAARPLSLRSRRVLYPWERRSKRRARPSWCVAMKTLGWPGRNSSFIPMPASVPISWTPDAGPRLGGAGVGGEGRADAGRRRLGAARRLGGNRGEMAASGLVTGEGGALLAAGNSCRGSGSEIAE